MTSPTLPALFLDRDGVIIENRENYVRKWADVAFYPQALTALARLHDWPGRIIIVTNQSVVGRGLITLRDADRINQRFTAEVTSAGGRIDAVFMCPHAPDDRCACRKPQPGLLLQAARAFGIDLQQSLLIGDALTDVAAGRAAGAGRVALVRTGRGQEQLQLPAARQVPSFPVYDTLEDAIEALLPAENPRPENDRLLKGAL